MDNIGSVILTATPAGDLVVLDDGEGTKFYMGARGARLLGEKLIAAADAASQYKESK